MQRACICVCTFAYMYCTCEYFFIGMYAVCMHVCMYIIPFDDHFNFASSDVNANY